MAAHLELRLVNGSYPARRFRKRCPERSDADFLHGDRLSHPEGVAGIRHPQCHFGATSWTSDKNLFRTRWYHPTQWTIYGRILVAAHNISFSPRFQFTLVYSFLHIELTIADYWLFHPIGNVSGLRWFRGGRANPLPSIGRFLPPGGFRFPAVRHPHVPPAVNQKPDRLNYRRCHTDRFAQLPYCTP